MGGCSCGFSAEPFANGVVRAKASELQVHDTKGIGNSWACWRRRIDILADPVPCTAADDIRAAIRLAGTEH